mgnify:FL=1
MSLRQQSLDLAILGRLMQSPSHGYELRKHVNAVLGHLHVVSFGSLYPALRRLLRAGLICDCASGPAGRLVGNRARRVYHLTAAGQDRLAQELARVDDECCTDDDFDVRFSLFGMTDPQARLRILQCRRQLAHRRLVTIESSMGTGGDPYATELMRFARASAQRELDWLDGLIAAEDPTVGEAVSSGSNPTKEI